MLSLTLFLASSSPVLAQQDPSTENFKMISSIEYTGKGQFKNQIETIFNVDKTPLANGQSMSYSITSKDFDLVPSGPGAATGNSPKALFFVVDKTDWTISSASEELVFLRKVNNQCVKFLGKRTKDNVGKTWKQTFRFPDFEKSLPRELKFTVSAISVKTEKFGEMIAVRALSNPFAVKAAKKGKGTGLIKSRINVAYLFDSKIEDIFLSASVFEATTKINGFNEKLQHEIATYKTDAEGTALDLNGLGKKFEKFIRKVGLSSDTVEVTKEAALPLWAHSIAAGSAQMANISGAIACEGASNPVLMVCIPTVHTISMQSLSAFGTQFASLGSVGNSLGAGVPAMGTMNFAAAPVFMGVGGGLGTTAAIIGGATAGGVAAGGGGGGGGGGTTTSVSP